MKLLAKPRQNKPPDVGAFTLPAKNEYADSHRQRRHEQGYNGVQLQHEPKHKLKLKLKHSHINNLKLWHRQCVLFVVLPTTNAAWRIDIVRLFKSMQIIIYPIMLEQDLKIL